MEYSMDRFFGNVPPKIVKQIKAACAEGEQFSYDAIPDDAVPCFVILAAFGRRIDVEIVDDYEALCERFKTAKSHKHPDLFLASGIIIMEGRGQEVTLGMFVELGIDKLFEQLYGEQE